MIMIKKTIESLIKLIFRGVIPIVFFVGGVFLFITRVSPWGVILGLPTIVIGMVMMIYTYDEVISKKVVETSEELTRCSVCGKLTPRQPGVDPRDTFCSVCKTDIKENITKEEKKE